MKGEINLTQFDIFLDILKNSEKVSWVDYEEETPYVKGAIFFGYNGERYEIVFDGGEIEEVIH